MKMKKYSKEKNQLDIKNYCFNWKYNYLKNMIEKHIRKEFRLRNIAETRNYFLEEIIQIQLVTKKYKKNCIILN